MYTYVYMYIYIYIYMYGDIYTHTHKGILLTQLQKKNEIKPCAVLNLEIIIISEVSQRKKISYDITYM